MFGKFLRTHAISILLFIALIAMSWLYVGQKSKVLKLQIKQQEMLLDAVEKDRELQEQQDEALETYDELSKELSNALEHKSTVCLGARDTDALRRLWDVPAAKK